MSFRSSNNVLTWIQKRNRSKCQDENFSSCSYHDKESSESLTLVDRSKQRPALLSVESSIYRTLAWRSSGENASLFWALPTAVMTHQAPSPMWGLLASSTVCLFVNHQDSLQLMSSRFTHIQWLAFSSLLESFCYNVSFPWAKSCHSHPLCDASCDEFDTCGNIYRCLG